jgi:pyrimidine-nucleoside phosphorylase
MISGRALGHTGGTLDKLESIPGFRTDLTIDQFRAQLAELGPGVSSGRRRKIAPADGALRAARRHRARWNRFR